MDANMSVVILILCLYLLSSASAKDLCKSDTPSGTTIHATNVTSVPSIHYILDAVECLKEAFTIYPNPEDVAEAYAELFHERHSETDWNVVVGYTAAHITSQWYVETTVDDGYKSKSDKDKGKATRYLIFSKA